MRANLVDLLRYRVQDRPDKQAYIFLQNGEAESGSLTYRELDRQAKAIAASLQLLAPPGARALLLYQSGLEFIAAFFGCLYAGIVAVPAYPPKGNRKMSRLQAIMSDSQAQIALTTEEILTKIESKFTKNPELSTLRWLATDMIAEEQAESWQEPTLTKQTLAFLQYTSGSTGNPKGVMVSHGNLLHNEKQIKIGFGHTEKTIFVGWLPLFHDMGLIGNVLQPMYLGIPSILMPPEAFLQKPLRWLQAISRYKATTSGGPNFAYDLCVEKIDPEKIAHLDLSSWEIAFNGAQPVRELTLKRFAAKFSPYGFRQEAFYPCYGMAETTLFVTGGDKGEHPKLLSVQSNALTHDRIVESSHSELTLVSCGKPASDSQVAIVNPETLQPCQTDEVGEIWVAGDHVAQGYWQNQDLTANTFKAYLNDQGPFLRTGDLGFLHQDELFVTGRLKDLIIICGRNHYPHDLEFTVENAHAGLRPDSGIAFSVEMQEEEKLVIVQEVKRTYVRKCPSAEIISAIRRNIAQEHDLQCHAIVLIKVASLPKTSSGKVKRRAGRQLFLDNKLEVVAQWRADFDQSTQQFPSVDQSLPKPTSLETASFEHSPAESVNSFSKPTISASPVVTRAEIQTWLKAKVANQLKIKPNELDIEQPLANYGLSSLLAITIAGELQEWLGCPLSPTLLYDYPSIAALSQHLSAETTSPLPLSSTEKRKTSQDAIAIVGVACRFPGANNPERYWQLLSQGKEAITHKIREGVDLGEGGFLENIDQFDPRFFNISPQEAQQMDPQQRLVLEVAIEALESAAIPPSSLGGTSTGVYIGISQNEYASLHPSKLNAYAGIGNALSAVANRLSYFLDLQGPSLAIDTACSSSLVAVHTACQSLARGEAEVAFAGGVNLILTPQITEIMRQAAMISPDSRCHTFGADANGYVRSEGVGMVVLKPLADAQRDGNPIWGVIQGSAVNQDGRSNGLTAPNGLAQQAVMRQAFAQAGVRPQDISYVETHGTGTALGDPIEVNSLKAVLTEGRSPEQTCWLGAAKANIGHLEAAAGIAGLIKVVMALKHRQIPPQPTSLQQLNPHFQLEGTGLEIPTTVYPWHEPEPKAGVSSFGFGGTNAYVVLAAAPSVSSTPVAESAGSSQLFTLSAKSNQALTQLMAKYADYFEQTPQLSLADVCLTSHQGRSHYDYRLALKVNTLENLKQELRNSHIPTQIQKNPEVVFLFTGQGSQYQQMGRELYETQPRFRATLDYCAKLLQPHLDYPLLDLLYLSSETDTALDQTIYTQPALFALEYALADLWQSWGIKPSAVLGHSLGEYVAACVAGVFNLETALSLVALRGRLIQGLPQGGAMVSIAASLVFVEQILEHYPQLSIAAINGSEMVVVSGPQEAIHRLKDELRTQEIKIKVLAISHAFHSLELQPIVAEFKTALEQVSFSTPKIPLISNLTGDTEGAITTPEYWCNHLLQPVQFMKGLQTLIAQGQRNFLEIGSKPILLSMVKTLVPDAICLPSLRPGKSDRQMLLHSLGQLYALGVDIDWQGFDPNARRISLPTYTFDRQRYWIADDLKHSEEKNPDLAQRQPKLTPTQHPNLLEYLQKSVAQVLGLNPAALDINKPLIHLGLDSLMVVELNNRVRTELGLRIEVPSASTIESLTIANLADRLREQEITFSPITSDPQEMTSVEITQLIERIENLTHSIEVTQLIEYIENLTHSEVDSLLVHLLSQ